MAQSTAEYIQHHLTNLTFGQHPDGTWGFAHSAAEAGEMGFWSINVDSMGWSIGLGLQVHVAVTVDALGIPVRFERKVSFWLGLCTRTLRC